MRWQSKERVLTAFARQTPDRVPVNFFSNPGIEARLQRHFGLRDDDQEGLLRVLGVDFRHLEIPYRGPQRHPQPPGVVVDEWGIHRRWIEHETGGYWDYCDWPLANATLEEVERWPLPSPDDYDYSVIRPFCAAHAEFAIVIGSPGFGDCINMGGMLRTMEQILVDLATDEPAGLRLLDRKIAVQLAILERGLETAQGVADVRRCCRETLEIMMPRGGYAFAPTHALQDNSPTENVVAMYETARQFGRYR